MMRRLPGCNILMTLTRQQAVFSYYFCLYRWRDTIKAEIQVKRFWAFERTRIAPLLLLLSWFCRHRSRPVWLYGYSLSEPGLVRPAWYQFWCWLFPAGQNSWYSADDIRRISTGEYNASKAANIGSNQYDIKPRFFFTNPSRFQYWCAVNITSGWKTKLQMSCREMSYICSAF